MAAGGTSLPPDSCRVGTFAETLGAGSGEAPHPSKASGDAGREFKKLAIPPSGLSPSQMPPGSGCGGTP
jgi:hypothetical protein